MSTGKRILIIVENLPVPFDRRVWQEATTLAAHGYQVSIICPKGKGHDTSEEVIDGINIYRHGLPLDANGALGYALEYGAALWHELRLALKVRRRHGVDAIHACNPPDLIFLIGGLFKLLFGSRFLFDHHDINPELYEAKFGRRDWGWHLMRWLERLTFRTADVVISTNESYRQIAITRGGKRPDDVFVVRSGPSLERLRILPPVEAERNGRRFLVGYVGVMGQQEGIEYLLEAARILVFERKRDDIQFALVGSGPDLARLEARTVELGLENHVTFTGRVPDEKLLAVLNTADVCVNPDEYNEMNDKSTMNKIVEYMALSKPIVQFDLTEGRVSAEGASLYAKNNDATDMADKIALLLDDPELRARMGREGRQRVETVLQWPNEVPRLLAAYERLFAAR